MKKLFLFSLFLLSSLCSRADGEYPYLTFVSEDGSVKSISVQNVNSSSSSESVTLELTISDGSLVAKNSEGTTLFTLSDLSKMYFSLTDESSITDGIDNPKSELKSSAIEVFSLSGISLGKFTDIESVKSKMSPGVYILKMSDQQIKISIK